MVDPENKNMLWERQLIEKVALSSLREQRRARLWSIFFKSLTFLYLFILLFLWLGWINNDGIRKSDRHTALIDLQGVISTDSISSADNINRSLQQAFKHESTQGVILRINSPGGSPVQAGIINDEIRRLRTIYPEIPLYAVIGDVCASGGYYVAVAADEIFVDKASLVGSIGVLIDGFGFTGTLEKLGIERRLLTAGESKGFLDPFSPQDVRQQEHAQLMLKEIHNQFIKVVKQGRGDRLKDMPEIFSGIVWTGERSIELGLTDAIGSTDYVAREVIMAEDIVDFTTKQGFAERFAKRLGKVAANMLNGGWQLR
ncbi:MAG: S49 family peptidase [Nitrosomonas sp.]|nr:S49 family peptidase [Nitrosomonas sp.]MDP1950304.1 S49 family peptidase [Nitrosomonas sp.]